MLAFGNVLAVMATSQMCGVHLCPLVILSTPPLQHTFEFGSAPTAGHPTPLSTNYTFTAHPSRVFFWFQLCFSLTLPRYPLPDPVLAFVYLPTWGGQVLDQAVQAVQVSC